MKTSIKISFSLLLLVIGNQQVNGQHYPKDTLRSTANKSELRLNIRYTSDYLYMGRKDSAAAPYLSPSITYHHRSGIFLRSSLSLLTKAEESRVDLITFSTGYDYYSKRFATGLAYAQYFFSNQSYAVQAEMSSYLRLYAAYDFDYFLINADAGLGISKDLDKFFSLEINRSFYIVNNKLSIMPAVYLNAGTQHYYNEYYSQRSLQTGSGYGKAWRKSQTNSISTLEINEADIFQVLDYEADLQIAYAIKNIKLYTIATWTFPVNPAIISTATGSYEEKLSNGFYWTAAIRLRF